MIYVNDMRKEFEEQEIRFKHNKTTICVDIKFRKDGEIFHIIKQNIEPTWYEDESGDGKSEVFYDFVSFRVDSSDLTSTEITKLLVNFLGNYKLYLHDYELVKDNVFVSYAPLELEEENFLGLKYCPKYRSRDIYLDAWVQLEDDVDYDKLLNIRIKKSVDEISDAELDRLGYGVIPEAGLSDYVILSDDDAMKVLRRG